MQLADPSAHAGAEWFFTSTNRPIRSDTMSDKSTHGIMVPRPVKIRPGGQGRSIRIDPDDSAELELVSTQMLKQILSARDTSEREAVKHAANTAIDGVLARDPGNGQFEIIDDDDLRVILDTSEGLPRLNRPPDATLMPLRDYIDDSQLSLVSTRALRQVLGEDNENEN
jgi:hypothetical protein